MRRRSSRRMWHTAAALVPLPLIGIGCLAFVSGNQLAVEVELYLSGPDSVYTATRTADAAAAPRFIPREAEKLFTGGRKGPRADHYAAAQAVTDAGKQIITASLTGSPGVTRTVAAVSRAAKADRLNPTTTDVARKGPAAGNPLFMTASYNSPFSANFEVDAFRPSPDEIAYRPAPEALSFRYQGETQAEFEERESRCLATAIYFEARGEPAEGQIAVAQVILNRVRSPIFPETICGVVFQGQHRKGCQFSFACDGHSDTPRDKEQWALAQTFAKEMMEGKHWLPDVGYSTFYHANYVSPRWARSMNKIDKIGRHIFYKKRNEEPYIVEASAEPADGSSTDDESGYLLPTLSLASAVSAVTGSGASSTPAMSLGFAGSE